MQYRRLGTSGIEVSVLCLGTMTFGEQNSESEAHAQLDYALQSGINFIDTAEMYAVPTRKETYGRSEEIIGSWIKSRKQRDRAVIATKVVGPDSRFPYIRDGKPRLNRRHIEAAVDASLKRLQTDYIDLYQLHWPERSTNTFGQLGYRHDAGEDAVALEETLGVLDDLIKAGKVRAVGASNETPWGMMRFFHLAETLGLPRMMSIQNPYNLLNRTYEVGLAEVSIRENCGLVSYGVLAAGMLTGKYLNGARPAGARLTRWPDYFPRYLSRGSFEATKKYANLAAEYGLSLTGMAIAHSVSQRFMTSVIVGATSVGQLQEIIEQGMQVLPDEALAGIEEIHAEQPNAYLIA